jgi:hypothetical protein
VPRCRASGRAGWESQPFSTTRKRRRPECPTWTR